MGAVKIHRSNWKHVSGQIDRYADEWMDEAFSDPRTIMMIQYQMSLTEVEIRKFAAGRVTGRHAAFASSIVGELREDDLKHDRTIGFIYSTYSDALFIEFGNERRPGAHAFRSAVLARGVAP